MMIVSVGWSRLSSDSALTRISHRLNPRLRGGAASPEAGRAEDYSGYENRGEDRKMRSEMPMDGLCLLEDDGVDTRCLSALRSSSSGGRIGQVAELGWEAAGFNRSEHTRKQCRVRVTPGERDPDLAHRHPNLRTDYACARYG